MRAANIIAGPSASDLALTVFHRNKLKEPLVYFKLAERYSGTAAAGMGEQPHAQIGVAIESVEREDDSDESFNIKGRISTSFGFVCASMKVQIYYNTRTRAGDVQTL